MSTHPAVTMSSIHTMLLIFFATRKIMLKNAKNVLHEEGYLVVLLFRVSYDQQHKCTVLCIYVANLL